MPPSRTDALRTEAVRTEALRADARRAEARALERGIAGPRDYRRAAQIYDELCADGCGDHAACRELLDAAFASRGTLMTPARAAIPARLCDRGDQVACYVASVLGTRDPSAFTGDLAQLCAAGDPKACLADLMFDLGDVGHVLARPRPLAACIAGVSDGCASLFAGLWPSCGEVPRGGPCVQAHVDAWHATGGDGTPLVIAWAQVQALCARGDALACDWVPGKEPDERAELALCSAGDFRRCLSLAHRGNDRAGAIACAAGMTELCTPSRPQPPLGVMDTLEQRDRCAKGEVAACKAAAARTAVRSCAI